MSTWYMVSSGPDRMPTGMALHPDEVPKDLWRDTVRRTTWPEGSEQLITWVDAETYEEACQRSAKLFAPLWRFIRKGGGA